jgi:hypothetical protein
MSVNVNDIVADLPGLKGQRDVIIPGEQSVDEIISEVLASHKEFASDYDTIAAHFYTASPLRTIFDFCRKNLPYLAESEIDQTTRSAIVILLLAQNWGVDCKHYSGFIAGVIDALNRGGYTNYDWCYRFASYDLFDSQKGHVFVVVNPGGNEIWLDPAPIETESGSFKDRTFNDRKIIPFYWEDLKPDKMSLKRISGCSINPMYQAMGYISAFQPATDDNYVLAIDTSVSDMYHIGVQRDDPSGIVYDPVATALDPISTGPLTFPTVSYDPGMPIYDPADQGQIENTNTTFIADYPTVTGEQPQTLPVATTNNNPAPATGNISTGFDLKTFIEANPLEVVLIGGSLAVGLVWLIGRKKKKKKDKRQRA